MSDYGRSTEQTEQGSGDGGERPGGPGQHGAPERGAGAGTGGERAIPPDAERVLEVAELIPPGRVMTYGDVAEWLASEDPEHPPGLTSSGPPDAQGTEGPAVPWGPASGPTQGARPGVGGPRQVGRAMALYGAAVPWWRVVRADGRLLPGSELRALEHYRAEGTPLREAGRTTEGSLPRLDMKRARWDGRGAGSHN